MLQFSANVRLNESQSDYVNYMRCASTSRCLRTF